MKKFTFPLERVLAVRRTQQEAEQAKLLKLQQQMDLLHRQEAHTRAQRTTAAEALQQQRSFVHGELQQFTAQLEYLRTEIASLQQRQATLAQDVSEQKRVLLEAERRVKLLERLREQKQDDWQLSQDLEMENFAAETYLGRWRSPSRS